MSIGKKPDACFDFSLDAQEFRERLYQQLKTMGAMHMHELEDDELEWVNAAGMLLPPGEDT